MTVLMRSGSRALVASDQPMPPQVLSAFFFSSRRRHTSLTCDWSSDVCSADLQLGKSGPQATMLCLGGMEQALSPDYIDIAWSMGIRYFDSADCYLGGRSEKIFGQWIAKYPERRKEIFLVSKDHPRQGPKQMLEMIDRRLEACGTKYLDAFYIHGIGPREYGDDS